MADETKFYFDFNFPLKLVAFLVNLIFGKRDPNNPAQTVDPANREWFSQPRTFADGGTEVITTAFKLPLSVSEITMEILRMPCTAEVWYQDRSNNWRQVLDMQRIPLKVNVSRSDVKSYFKYQVKIYPIVAKKLQFRLTRLNDLNLEGTPFPVGLKNCLIRRNVYDRSQGSQYFGIDSAPIMSHGCTRIAAPSSLAASKNSNNSGASRFQWMSFGPLMCEPICTPCSPNSSMQRSSSRIASCGLCRGTVPMPA